MNVNEKVDNYETNTKKCKKSSITLTIYINLSANKCLRVAKMYCRTFPEWMRLSKKTLLALQIMFPWQLRRPDQGNMHMLISLTH